MSNVGPVPTLGNLSWIPFAGADQVEFFDSHNGVPSLGTVQVGADCILFWRSAFYTQNFSVWLYVPLTAEEAARIEDQVSPPLDGIVFGLQTERFATIGVADETNRLAFEREWCVPAGLTPETSYDLIVDYAIEVMELALSQDPPLPPTRLQIVQHAKDAVRQQLETAGRS